MSEQPPQLPAYARLHMWQIQAFRDALVVAAFVGLVWSGYLLRAVTVPLLVALLLAYLFEPIVQRLSRLRYMNRARAVAAILAAVVVSFLVVLSLVIPLVVAQAVELARDVREGSMRIRVARLEQFVPAGFEDEFRNLLEILPAAEPAGQSAPPGGGEGAGEPRSAAEPAAGRETALTEARVREIAAEAVREARERESRGGPDWLQVARRGAAALWDVISAVVGIGLLAFLIPFFFFFFSLSYPAVLRFGRSMIPARNRVRTLALLGRMDQVVSGFVRGRIVISLIMGVMLAVGWMWCGVPYAILLGLVIGVFCAVPYLGAVGVPVAAGLLFFKELGGPHESASWWIWPLLWPTLAFVVVQIVEGYALTPMIAGKATNLDPVTIIVAVLAGGSVLGVYGMLLAIPVAACLKVIVTDVLLPKMRAWLEGLAEDPLPIERD